MGSPVNIIKIERVKLKSGIKTYRILVDKKPVQDHFQDALANVVGSQVTWSDKNHAIVDGSNLLKSGKGSGRFAIFNCACGSGGECAGLENTIDVSHVDDVVEWTYRAPRHKSERSDRTFVWRFHKPQYLQQLDAVEPTNDLEGLPGYGH